MKQLQLEDRCQTTRPLQQKSLKGGLSSYQPCHQWLNAGWLVQGIADAVNQQIAEARAAAQRETDAAEIKRLQSVQRRASKEALQQVPLNSSVLPAAP